MVIAASITHADSDVGSVTGIVMTAVSDDRVQILNREVSIRFP